MRAPGRTQITSFLAGVGAIGLAGVLTRACPGGCSSCAACATALVPMGISATAVGAAFVGSATARKRRATRDGSDTAPEFIGERKHSGREHR